MTGAGFIAWTEIAAVGLTSPRQPPLKCKIKATNRDSVGSPAMIPGHTTMPLEEIIKHIQVRLGEQSWSQTEDTE